MNNNEMYPAATNENAKKKADLAPTQIDAWRNFSRAVFKEGALDEKTKQHTMVKNRIDCVLS